ncbi:uncharacterized protein LOC134839644 isoform X2 [Symsagittifera roscoffensis]
MFLPLSLPPVSSKQVPDTTDAFFSCESIPSLLSPSKRVLSPIQPSSLDEHISAGSTPSRILPFLYLGGSKDASNSHYLKTHNVQFIINCGCNDKIPTTTLNYKSGKSYHKLQDQTITQNKLKKNDSYVTKTEYSEKSDENGAIYSRQISEPTELRNGTKNEHTSPNGQQVLNIAALDSPQQDLMQYFVQIIKFIERGRLSNSSVLVHCSAGISRSATLVVAYVMWYLKLPFMTAYKYVQNTRPQISPNLNFVGQLVQFASELSRDESEILSRIGFTNSRLQKSDPNLPVATNSCRKRSISENVPEKTVTKNRKQLTNDLNSFQ